MITTLQALRHKRRYIQARRCDPLFSLGATTPDGPDGCRELNLYSLPARPRPALLPAWNAVPNPEPDRANLAARAPNLWPAAFPANMTRSSFSAASEESAGRPARSCWSWIYTPPPQ